MFDFQVIPKRLHVAIRCVVADVYYVYADWRFNLLLLYCWLIKGHIE